MSPRRRLLLAGCAALAALAVGVTLVLSAVRRQQASAQPAVDQSRPGTVLLVPGYGGGTGGLTVLANRLRALGRTAVVVPAVGNGTGDLRAQAAALEVAADAAVAAGSPSVDVIGYSAGGVVARIWADDLHGNRIARRVVTLGAPHHGTEVAALGAAFARSQCPLACQQLVPSSALLRGLAQTPPGPVWTALYTEQDQVVTPPDSGRLQGAVVIDLQRVCADEVVAHGDLPTDALVTGIVERALAAQPLAAAPTPVDCSDLRAAGNR